MKGRKEVNAKEWTADHHMLLGSICLGDPQNLSWGGQDKQNVCDEMRVEGAAAADAGGSVGGCCMYVYRKKCSIELEKGRRRER